MFYDHSAYTGRSHFIFGVSAMDLTSFHVTNEVFATSHVFPAS